MSLKLVPLVAALTLAGAANAVSVNMTDFEFGPAASVNMTGGQGYGGQAGAFAGTLTDSPPANIGRNSITATSPTSFVAWCAQLTQSFSFGVTYDYSFVGGTAYFGAQKADDLSRLFTAAAANHFVFDSNGSAAFQAGIWEIIYETSGGYDFDTGTEHGAPANPNDPSAVTAFNTVDGFLTTLGQYSASYKIDVLTNDAQQDFLVATIPEPETWALFAAGLGVIGLLRRRRKA
jgi:hypothetical protein